MLPDQPRTGARHLVPCAAVLLLSLLCGACGDAEQQAPSPAAAARPAPATLERIEAALGCRAEVTVDADELREGGCEAAGQSYRMATFAADEGRRAWLAESLPYGGTYLVGDLWVVTAPSPDALTPLRDRLGGTLRSGASHGPEHAPTDAPEHAPSDAPEHASTDGPGHAPSDASEDAPPDGPDPTPGHGGGHEPSRPRN
ncbi:hypothetical protein J7E97_03840 [Streptomyces sp. ISL-66]|uniref:hypothetical protein n=1 Tax=Streptomyces sp. ISL-66 TaxID=2819186 RepID=UPI001BE8FB71|nr:hypothetical protein [Streptomyces sp. ISL-66]MBT2467024.1 hypothetical protein [Streptomyces sp. ISL-66]